MFCSGVEVERFSGTDGKAMKPDELKEVATFSARWLCTKGVIGCFLSHRRIWQKAYPMGRMLPLALQELLAKKCQILDMVTVAGFNCKLQSPIRLTCFR